MPIPISGKALADAIQSSAIPQVIDVRRQPVFDASQRMIVNAVWRNPEEIEDWIFSLDAGRSVIVYCVHGHQVSQGCAERLEQAGFHSNYLEGGFEQWTGENYPTITK
ncbi:MAG TPA: rhodanese family chromate resistance protein ChrE [Burkholderiaceae bacterium]|jgi:rhodanese-related sulfurtransferase|nr:rhodanese family chromate resistance protein ChrE [Burkholderiaceae bacterium]